MSKIRKWLPIVATALLLLVSAGSKAFADWSGVDEAVVEKYASQYGREASQPIINTDQGDLLLFVFAIAGSIGGFIVGYYWRKLFRERSG